MSKTFPEISYCLAVHNEEKFLLGGLSEIESNLRNLVGDGHFEIVVGENGSTDSTKRLLEQSSSTVLRPIFITKRGLGFALRECIKASAHEHVAIGAIDVPFGFEDLCEANELWEKYDIIFGSKSHHLSKVKRNWQRRLFSKIYHIFLKPLFGLRINDSQGSVFIKKSKIIPILPLCNAENAFFTTQLAIYGQLFGLKMTEIPITMRQEMRPSKFSITKDGAIMFISIIKELIRYQRIKRRLNL